MILHSFHFSMKTTLFAAILSILASFAVAEKVNAYSYHNRFQYVPGNHGGVYSPSFYDSQSHRDYNRLLKPSTYETFPGSNALLGRYSEYGLYPYTHYNHGRNVSSGHWNHYYGNPYNYVRNPRYVYSAYPGYPNSFYPNKYNRYSHWY